MKHILITAPNISDAVKAAHEHYASEVKEGRHAILDVPGDFRTNLPERRLSCADVLVTARRPHADPARQVVHQAMQKARDALGTLWMSFPETDHNAILATQSMDSLDYAIKLTTTD